MNHHRLGVDVVTAPSLKLSGYTGAGKDSNTRPQGPIVEDGASLTDKSNVSSRMPCVSTADRI